MPNIIGRLSSVAGKLLSFSRREGRRVLLLIPLLAVASLLFLWVGKPSRDESFILYTGKMAESEGFRTRRTQGENSGYHDYSRTYSDSSRRNVRRGFTPFEFDPNTITHEGLVKLGFSPRQADVIVRYRDRGAVFRSPEDFARCYTVSGEAFAALKPYIRIGEEFSRKNTRPETTQGNPHSGEVSSGTAATTTSTIPSQPSLPLELNGADSAALVTVRGIGPLTAGRIVEYRRRLGGFVSASQLQEVEGMTDKNYQLILQQICVDSSVIQKIDINFALPQELAGHPYIAPTRLAKLLKYRQLKGGWSNYRDLIKDKIFSEEEAERLSAYLYFSPVKGEF